MKCSNCGKNIPYAGNVCPYCHVNKSSDQWQTFAFWLVVIVWLLASAALGKEAAFVGGALISIFVLGAVVWVALSGAKDSGKVAQTSVTAQKPSTQPAEHSTKQGTTEGASPGGAMPKLPTALNATPQAVESNVRQRLRELEALRLEGAVSQAEYDEARARILKSI